MYSKDFKCLLRIKVTDGGGEYASKAFKALSVNHVFNMKSLLLKKNMKSLFHTLHNIINRMKEEKKTIL